MTRLKPASLKGGGCLLMMAASLLLSACASHDKPQYDISTGAGRRGADGSAPDDGRTRGRQGQVRASNQPDDSWGDAVMAPLEDLNLRKQEIPDILTRAITKPYDLTGLDSCENIAAEVSRLDALLGADFDEPPPPPDQRNLAQKGGSAANKAAVGAVRNASRSIIPFRGIVRSVTGADAHQKQMDTAIQAGKVRRAYLKGVGMNKNCAPPAAPSWFKPRVYVQSYDNQPQPMPVPARPKRKGR